MRWITGMLAGAVLLGAIGAAHGQVVDKKALTLEAARLITATAIGEARRLGAPGGAIAIVDDGGNLVALERLDGTFAAGATISIGKARTAALFKKPTRAFEDIIRQGRTAMVALPDFTPLQGGVPIVVGEEVVGAIGVSGAASAAQDEEIAKAGAAAAATLKLGASGGALSSTVTHIDRATVASGFDKGAVLVNSGNYMIHASHRDKDGVAEIHTLDTDLVYILEGAATLVTGGQAPDASVTEPNELRGPAIVGGESRRVVKGDVVVIPAGVPHMFTEVQEPLNYYVVKVR
jgi:glc operon protein GlcG